MELLTTSEAAIRLGVTVARVHALILAHRLPALKVGRDYVIDAFDLSLVNTRQPGRTPAQLHLDYWTAFVEFLVRNQSRERRQTSLTLPHPSTERYLVFRLGRTHFRLAANIRPRDRQIWVDLTLGGPHAKRNFKLLKEQKDQVASDIGGEEPIEWHERPTGVESWILVRLRQADPADRNEWSKQHEWLCKKLHAFHRAFERRAKDLK